MTGRRMDQMVITKKMMDEDPNFASFSDVTNTAECDNSSSHRRSVITLGGFFIFIHLHGL